LWALSLNTNQLFLINPANASPTLKGTFTSASPMRTLAFDVTTGRMFGTTLADQLYQINPDTAASTFIGPVSGATNIGSLASDQSGNLWAQSELSNGLYKINTTTGAATLVSTLTTPPGSVTDIAFRPSDDALFAIANFGTLFRVDPATGASTAVGQHGAGFMVGLAFTEVPEPGSLAFAATAGVMAALGRRRGRHQPV
jgi:hypothetical protein